MRKTLECKTPKNSFVQVKTLKIIALITKERKEMLFIREAQMFGICLIYKKLISKEVYEDFKIIKQFYLLTCFKATYSHFQNKKIKICTLFGALAVFAC